MTFRSGFVSLVGRPNVGKSTLVNRVVGAKVAIVSSRPQTTRTQIRGVRTTPDTQIVLLDTPGIHKPRTMLGERTNERARSTLREVDVVCMLVDATAPIGRGDQFVADLVQAVPTPKILVVSKTDIAAHAEIAEHLAVATAKLGEFDAYVPLSGLTGQGVDALVGEIESRLPEGPVYYPNGEVTDQPETFLAAELLREKLLLIARDELPHSIAVVVEEIEPGDGDDDRRSRRGEGRRDRAPAGADPRGAGLAEGDRDRQGRRGPQGSRHEGAGGARGAARDPRLPPDPGQGRTGLAAPRALARPPRILNFEICATSC